MTRPSDLMRQAFKLGMLPYAGATREHRPGILILAYHQVGGGDSRQLDLPVSLFQWQLEYLRGDHRVIGMNDVLQIAKGGGSYNEDFVVLTFDDGYEDVYRHVYPLLVRFQLPATIYLSTAFVESGQRFVFHRDRPTRRRRGAPLTWAQLDEMCRSGLVTIGAHTHTHADLSGLAAQQLNQEIMTANDLIRERLGLNPVHFACPWGRVSEVAWHQLASSYRTIAAGGMRKNLYGRIDPKWLFRIPIQRSDGRFFFRLKLGAWRIASPSMMRPMVRPHHS